MSQNMVSPVAEVGALDSVRAPNATDGLGHVGVAHALLSIAEMDRVLATAPFGTLTERQRDRLTLNDKQRWIMEKIKDGSATTVNLLPPLETDTGDPTTEVHPYGTVWHNTVSGDVFQTPGDGTWAQII